MFILRILTEGVGLNKIRNSLAKTSLLVKFFFYCLLYIRSYNKNVYKLVKMSETYLMSGFVYLFIFLLVKFWFARLELVYVCSTMGWVFFFFILKMFSLRPCSRRVQILFQMLMSVLSTFIIIIHVACLS